MRINAPVTTALLSSLALTGHVLAEESKTGSAGLPSFTPTDLKAPFIEQFTEGWDVRWTPSHAKKEDSQSEEDWVYVGTWSVEEPSKLKGIDGDKGLVVKDAAAHHAISAKFPEPIDNKGKTLVVQYEVKLQDNLNCGGAYMKLLQDNKQLHAEEFSNASPYVIMFGPDKCGATNKVHFIFKHKNPKTGEYEEKHMKSPPAVKVTPMSTLYTLIVKPDQTFQIQIDGEAVKNGTLLDDFSPSVNPPKEIDDPDDRKPADWVDEPRIPDPEATKPEDWDEDAPFEIVDTEAEKPDDWLENEPTSIPDPEAEKPQDWDDEEDGDWIPPTVPNPKCEDVSGCGEWKPPMKRNPDFRGKWTAPFIDNPAYKGPWAPRKVANPSYFEDKTPSDFEPMGGIGFEIWTMQKDILFDNIYVGHSIEDAKKLKEETWDVKHNSEVTEEHASEAQKKPEASDSSFKEDPLGYVRQRLNFFIGLVKQDPVAAVKAAPDVAGGLGAVVVTLVLVVVGAIGLSTPPPPPTPTNKKEKGKGTSKDAPAEASSSGADKSAEGTKKRSGKSSE